MKAEDLYTRMSRLDQDAFLTFGTTKHFQIILVGGSALILLGVLPRATLDMDALNPPPELFHLMAKYDMNGHVGAYINNFPYNLEDRLIPIPVGGKCISFFTASLEDIVIAKLFSERETDRLDIAHPQVLSALNWEKLIEIAESDEEVKNNALNERCYSIFRFNYTEYLQKFKKEKKQCDS